MKKSIEGQSLFEILFAIAIAAILITGVASLATTSVRNTDSARDNALAARYAQQGTEWLRTQRDSLGWNDFISEVEGQSTDPPADPSDMNFGDFGWPGSSSAISGTIFSRVARFSCFDSTDVNTREDCGDDIVDLVRSEVEVSWTDSQGDHSVVSSTQLSSWQE